MNHLLSKQIDLKSLLCILMWILMVFFSSSFFYHAFFSTIIICLVMTVAIVRVVGLRLDIFFLGIFFSIFLAASMISILIFGVQQSFVTEFFKIFFVFIGGMLIASAYTSEAIAKMLRFFPMVLIVYLLFLMWSHGFSFHQDHRLGLPDTLGGPNTVGFFISVAIIILLADDNAIAKFWLKLIIIIILLTFLATTFSRSAIFGLLLGYLYAFFLKKKKRTSGIVLFVCIVFIFWLMMHYFSAHADELYYHEFAKFNVFSDVKKTGGSGRLTIWVTVLRQWFVHPKAWLTGFGPGLISKFNLFDMRYKSIDSFPMMSIYSYGIIGFIASLFIYYKLLIVKKDDCYVNYKRLLGAFLFFVLIVNNTTSASQAVFLGMLIFAFVLSRNNIGIKRMEKVDER